MQPRIGGDGTHYVIEFPDLPGCISEAESVARTVPDEAWDALPTDLAANYKHYLYGTRKDTE